jgi:hypothetical protein
MKLVVVTQWVRALRLKSHLTNASPAGPERTPRANPAMGVRSGSERGGRAACLSPAMGIVVDTRIPLTAVRRGKADGLHAPEGNRPRRVLASVWDTTGV